MTPIEVANAGLAVYFAFQRKERSRADRLLLFTKFNRHIIQTLMK